MSTDRVWNWNVWVWVAFESTTKLSSWECRQGRLGHPWTLSVLQMQRGFRQVCLLRTKCSSEAPYAYATKAKTRTHTRTHTDTDRQTHTHTHTHTHHSPQFCLHLVSSGARLVFWNIWRELHVRAGDSMHLPGAPQEWARAIQTNKTAGTTNKRQRTAFLSRATTPPSILGRSELRWTPILGPLQWPDETGSWPWIIHQLTSTHHASHSSSQHKPVSSRALLPWFRSVFDHTIDCWLRWNAVFNRFAPCGVLFEKAVCSDKRWQHLHLALRGTYSANLSTEHPGKQGGHSDDVLKLSFVWRTIEPLGQEREPFSLCKKSFVWGFESKETCPSHSISPLGVRGSTTNVASTCLSGMSVTREPPSPQKNNNNKNNKQTKRLQHVLVWLFCKRAFQEQQTNRTWKVKFTARDDGCAILAFSFSNFWDFRGFDLQCQTFRVLCYWHLYVGETNSKNCEYEFVVFQRMHTQLMEIECFVKQLGRSQDR